MALTSRSGSALLLVCAFLAGLGAGGDAVQAPWCSFVDTALAGWNVSSIKTNTHKLCYNACLESANCSSANYWWQSKVCELNAVSHLSVSDRHLVQASGSIYTFMCLVSVVSFVCQGVVKVLYKAFFTFFQTLLTSF